jgi:hypothetical protein
MPSVFLAGTFWRQHFWEFFGGNIPREYLAGIFGGNILGGNILAGNNLTFCLWNYIKVYTFT